jgi:nucleoside-diphosphate-sugar epimerase
MLWQAAYLHMAIGCHSTDSVLHSNAQFIKADIQSADLISHVLQTEEIDTIMHFAAQVRAMFEDLLCSKPSDMPKMLRCALPL